MCGKFTQKLDLTGLAALLDLPMTLTPPNAAVTPGRQALTIEAINGPRLMRWGFASAPGLGTRPLLHARAETMTQKPLFRDAATTRRCLLPADSFHEGGLVFTAVDGPLLLGALWQKGHDDVLEFVVITEAAQGAVAAVHDRSPLLLTTRAEAQDWLFRAKRPVQTPPLRHHETTPPADNRQMALF